MKRKKYLLLVEDFKNGFTDFDIGSSTERHCVLSRRNLLAVDKCSPFGLEIRHLDHDDATIVDQVEACVFVLDSRHTREVEQFTLSGSGQRG